jgi:hypothetical protein
MVPFEFASILLLVAMIGTVYCLKEKQRNNMNNILNEIGIENYIFLSTILFCIGVFGVYTGEMQYHYFCQKLC